MIKIWLSYIKEHIKSICMYAGCLMIFAVVYFLYNIRTDAVFYAFLLTFVWILIYGAVDFCLYFRRYAAIVNIGRQIASELGTMPRPGTRLEREYQDIIQKLYECKADLESGIGIARQEMVDYYSLWVHQIKTPIAAMRILLQAEKEQSREEDHTKELSMELFKIEQYVEMVLSYLRMEDMSSDMILKWYGLDEIVKQAVRKYSQMFILQKIKLNFDRLDTMVLTDEKWLVFVIEQILSNALKYTKKGSISIYMDPDREQTLVIEDTGIGIWEEDLPRVFEKGFTGYNGRKDKKSTGIGLYLCKTVSDRLNHSMYLESVPEKGTKVFLNLSRDELPVE